MLHRPLRPHILTVLKAETKMGFEVKAAEVKKELMVVVVEVEV